MIEILQGENSASQNATNILKLKIERTQDALQIAGTNAANARAEADASNARVESLTCQMNVPTHCVSAIMMMGCRVLKP